MENHQELIRLAHRSKSISTVVEDYEFLATLLSNVSPTGTEEQARDKIFDSKSYKVADLQTLYKISEKCDSVWTAREGVDWLMFYLFYRRYGWEDVTFQRDKVQLFAPSIMQRLRVGCSIEELRFQERIKSLAGDLISWFERCPLRLTSLKMMNSAVRIAKCAQTTRHFLVLFIVRWLTNKLDVGSNGPVTSQSELREFRRLSLRPSQTTQSPFLPEDATPEAMFSAVQDLILLCMTDSIHAIRFTVIPSVAKLLDQLSLGTIQKLLDNITELFNRQEVETWEAAEGLLNALGLLVKRMMPRSPANSAYIETGHTYGSTSGMSSETFERNILPKLKGLVYNLFDYDHPSVRTCAVQLLLTCLKRCQRSVVEQSLDEIMSELCDTVEFNPTTMKAEQGPSLGLHAAESLLSLCQSLLKILGGGRLPPSTGDLQNNLVRTYLGHPNQGVQLAACKVYETLTIMALENPNRVRYLLGKLLENWPLRQDVLLSPLQRTFAVTGDTRAQATPKTINPGGQVKWIEGRLFIFEKVCHAFVQFHCATLSNQLLRAGNTDSDLDLQHTRQSVYLEGRRPSLYSVGSPKSPGTLPKRPQKGGSLIARLSIAFEDDGALTSRSESSLSTRSSSIMRIRNFGLKREQTPNMSALDRLRASDEADKHRQLDAARPSVWRSQVARQLSIVARRSTIGLSTVFPTGSDIAESRLRVVLSTMLHACCENLVAEPKELRQRARQAFSEVSRFICWYDAEMFNELLYSHLTFQTTLMTYCCLKVLRRFLENACTFVQFVASVGSLDIAGSGYNLKSFDTPDGTPEGYFLNVPMLRLILGSEQSATWLRACQQYLTNDMVPTFIVLPAFDCVITILSLAHSLHQFTAAAKHVESVRPTLTTSTEQPDAILFALDPGVLADAVRAATNFVRRFEVRLDKHFKPTTVNAEHLKIVSLRPFFAPDTPEKDTKSDTWQQSNILAPALSRLINTLEQVLFPFLPPTPNSTSPDPTVRRAAGYLLAPMLFNLVTWPLALLPPVTNNERLFVSGNNEMRILAVRKLLRIVASIVHALPPAKFGSPKSELSSTESAAFTMKLEEIAENRTDLTTTVNSYFTQLEGIFSQLSEACAPTIVSASSSWWWFRALCEHVPRMIHVAPHANPVSLIRLLMDEVSRQNTTKPSHNPKNDTVITKSPDSKKMHMLWNKAIDFAKQNATTKTTECSSELEYSWLTVGGGVQIEQKQQQDQSVCQNVHAVDKEQGEANEIRRKANFFLEQEKPPGVPQSPSSMNPAFDYLIEEDEPLTLERAEPDSSSGEEQSINRSSATRSRLSYTKSLRRRRHASTSMIKPQAIETPPAFQDILGLVKRVWVHCEPITMRTLKNLLSAAELSLIMDGNGTSGKL